MLHPQAQALLRLMVDKGIPPTHTLPHEQAREFYLMRRTVTQPEPPEVGLVRNLAAPGPAGDIPLRLYRPLGSDAGQALPVLVYYHGGGWVIGDLDTHDVLCRQLCNGAGCAVVSVDYRLAPEHRFPAAVEDAIAATRWIHANAQALGLDAARFAVGGDSAGGNLAAVVALTERDAGASGLPIAFQLLIYPATDQRRGWPSHTTNGEGYLLTRDTIAYFHDLYVGEAGEDLDWRLSPLLHDSHAGLPPGLRADRRLRPAARRGRGLRAEADRGRQPRRAGEFRAPDPRLHHHGQGARRSQRGGAAVRVAAARGAAGGVAGIERAARLER